MPVSRSQLWETRVSPDLSRGFRKQVCGGLAARTIKGMEMRRKLSDLGSQLRSRAQILALGTSARELEQAVSSGKLRRLRRGWYADGEVWRILHAEDRHLMRVVAAARAAIRQPVFSHVSAAALHGLPLYRHEGTRVHTIGPTPAFARSSTRVLQHAAVIDEAEVQVIGPLRFTCLERTVIDVARTESPELSVACADAAARLAGEGSETRQQWIASLRQRLVSQPGLPGNAAARLALGHADGSADSVLESVSRLYLQLLGFEVRSQVEVPSPNGAPFRVDFELVGCDVFGEVDGMVKYSDDGILRGRSPHQVVIDEKRREDWIRGTTGKRIIRWGASDLVSLETFARLLRSYGVLPPLVPPRPRSSGSLVHLKGSNSRN